MNKWIAISATVGSCLALFGCSTPTQAPSSGLVVADVTVVSPERATPLLHLDDKIGTVEPGRTANLVLLRANPLESVTAFDTIDTVFLHGRPIPRAELSARIAP
jgi:hypothetical protein